MMMACERHPMADRSAWEGYHEPAGALHFKVYVTDDDLRKMSRRQTNDLYLGLALVAAAFVDDSRFIDGDGPAQRAESVRLDQRLGDLMKGDGRDAG